MWRPSIVKDIMHCDNPFGGKCIIMGGDFRQILPVIKRGSRASIVDACKCVIFMESL